MEICNLADIDRKLDLYKAMFYHNTQSDRDSNFITMESLKIELIAGGLNLKQQAYILEKMEPNNFGEVKQVIKALRLRSQKHRLSCMKAALITFNRRSCKMQQS